jgi:hypothetical protein
MDDQLIFWYRCSTGQESVRIHRLTTSHGPVFLVNSRFPQFSAPLTATTSTWRQQLRSPFFQSYGGILPSSFTMILSIASVYSTNPPVSV